ncbi:hypothetical protein [Streptosporangium sp. NPDC000396]|uniref:hypothetical protein n=1 Tax=Streptosporangium sp. NPDC000396 TaxID=3366185 RepID=UPI00368CAA9C
MTHQQISPEVLPAVPENAEPAEEERGSVVQLLERIGSVLVPIAVALYALLYLGIQSVYWIFGITPEQAGIDQATLFGRLVGTLITLFLLALPTIGVLIGLAWLADKITRGWVGRAFQRIRERPWIAAALAALWCGASYWGFLSFYDVNGLPMLLTALGLAVFGFLVPFRLLRGRPNGRAGLKVLTGALTGIGLGFVLIGQMVVGALDIYENGKGNFVLTMVGFQDQWVEVRAVDDDKPIYGEDRMMLLGEHEGAYVFYDCATQETLRRPIEATNLGRIELNPTFGDDVEPCGYRLETKEGQ